MGKSTFLHMFADRARAAELTDRVQATRGVGGRALASIESLTVSDWVRPLFRATGASGEWHAPRIKGLSTETYCDKTIEGPLEITREDRAERDGRCATCTARLTPSRVRGAAVAKPAVKTAAAKKSVNRPTPKKKSGRPSVAKHSVRHSRRGRT